MKKKKKRHTEEYIITFECKLAMFLVATSMLYFFATTFLPIPEENQKFVGTVSGILIYAIKDILIWAFKTAKIAKDKANGKLGERNNERR